MSRRAYAVFLDRLVPYDDGLDLQQCVHAARLEGRLPDTVFFLRHRPVITLGRRARDQHLLVSRGQLADRGVELHVASRGGDVTYHGPGQWVIYPILHLGDREADAHGYLWNLEEIALRTAADFGVEAWRREGKNGAWTDQGKIAAIGFHIRRWVTLHGMSFNVGGDLDGFRYIVPCGLVGEPVASLETVLGGGVPDEVRVRDRLAHHLAEVLQRPLEILREDEEWPEDLRTVLSDAVIP